MSPLLPTVVAIGGFAAALLGMASLWTLVRATPGRSPRTSPTASLLVRETPLLGFTRAIASLARPLDEKSARAVADELVQAGFDDRTVLPLWFAIRGAFLLLPIGPTWLMLRGHGVVVTIVGLVIVVALGDVAPALLLDGRRRLRQRQIRRAAPTMLDMLVSTIGSGLPIEPSIAHVAAEIASVSPALAVELGRVGASVANGVPRGEALEAFAKRTGVEEVASLVALLGQSERFGTAVAAALRAHAENARKRSLLEAEQRATRMASVLTIVMTLVVLPAVLVVLVGPMVVEVAGALTGGAP